MKDQDIIDMYNKQDRHFTLYVGPTNSGKTYNAVQKLADAETGVYLAPLRLLAFESYERLNSNNVPCTLITGEEKAVTPNARHVSSTIEMLDNKHYDVAVIDEAQMINDFNRGGAWTKAILGVNADEVCVCCAPEAEHLIERLIDMCGNTYDVVQCERMTDLQFEPGVQFGDIREHDAVVCFSAKGVKHVASVIEDSLGLSCSTIYGAMPYEIKQAQAKLFAEGKTQVVVATDAIGMGMNLPIERIVFEQTSKFDGYGMRDLYNTEIKQIAGRAGRYGIYDTGYFASLEYDNWVNTMFMKEPNDIETAYINVPDEAFCDSEYVSETLEKFSEEEGSVFSVADLSEKILLAKQLEFKVWSSLNNFYEFLDMLDEEGVLDEEDAWFDEEDAWFEHRDMAAGTQTIGADLIRKFIDLPVSGNISLWEKLFDHEFYGEPLPSFSAEESEDLVKDLDLVAAYARKFKHESLYQETRKLRNECIGKMERRIKAKEMVFDGFSEWQAHEIREGYVNGLNKKQISMYADPEFDIYQMQEIRWGLESGLTNKQVSVYADPKFNDAQMGEIRCGFKHGLTDTQVNIYASLEFDCCQMSEIRKGFKHGFSSQQMSVYADPKFDSYQMHQIRCGFQNGLSVKQVSMYADPKFNDDQMGEIRCGFKHGLTDNQVSVYADPKFDSYQMAEIRKGFENDFSSQQMSVYADPKFESYQMRQIREGFEEGFSIEQVSAYADSKFNDAQIKEIRWGLESGLTDNQVSVYADPKFRCYQMAEIRKGFEHDLSNQQMSVYADPKFNSNQMRQIREGFEEGFSIEQVSAYADPKFNDAQIKEIRWGLEGGLTDNQVSVYADPKFSWHQMQEIRLGFENGLGQVSAYADPELDWFKMNEVRNNCNKEQDYEL